MSSAAGFTSIRLYRTVGPQEMADVILTGLLRPGPPSFQGKWLAESVHDAARWGRRFFQQAGLPFHVVEVEVAVAVADRWYRDPNLDRIGPARYAEIADLPQITIVCEVGTIPILPP